jgi:hypothetical protein
MKFPFHIVGDYIFGKECFLSLTPMPVMGVKECLPWGYRRHWNEVWEALAQVIEGIPVFSPCNFKVDSYDR